MKHQITCTLLLGILISFAACGHRQTGKISSNDSLNARLPGDTTFYGYACEGCCDSVIIVMPEDGSDPIRFNTLKAFKRKQVKGTPKTGDWVAVLRNGKNPNVADFVVNLEELKGTWCYRVMPILRGTEQLSKEEQQKRIQELPDSIRETFFVPREYGFSLKRQWLSGSVGYNHAEEGTVLDDENPAVYPALGYFTGWRIWNGKLVITSGKLDFSKGSTPQIVKIINDTCNIDYLSHDSLYLSDETGARGYYKK